MEPTEIIPEVTPPIEVVPENTTPPSTQNGPVEEVQTTKLQTIVDALKSGLQALSILTGNAFSADKAYSPESRDATDPLKVHRGLMLVYPKFTTLMSTDGITTYLLPDENAARRLLGSKYQLVELKDTEGINARTKEAPTIIAIKTILNEVHETLAPIEGLKESVATPETLKAWLIAPPEIAAPPVATES